MVLSKDIDVIEEIKTLELTTAQKRRLRRKKLKAARAGTLDIDITAHKDILGLNKLKTQKNKSIGNSKEDLSNKKDKKNNTQGINNQTPSLKKNFPINSQETKCEKPVISNDIKSAPKAPKNKELNGSNTDVSNEKFKKLEKPLTIVENSPENSNLDLDKKEKYKLNGSHPVKLENLCVIENKKNKPDNTISPEKQVAANLELNKKEEIVPQTSINNSNYSPKLKDLNENKTHIQTSKENVLIQEQLKIDSSKSENHNKNLENPELDIQVPIKPESVETITPILDKPNMGKIQDSVESQKKQEGTSKGDLKKEDTSSADTSAKSRDEIKAAREAKKLAKQKGKKKDDVSGNVEVKTESSKPDVKVAQVKENVAKIPDVAANKTEQTKTEPVKDLKQKENISPAVEEKAEDKEKKNIVGDSKDVKSETTVEKTEEVGKSKAELRAERRAKQEAQRLAKQEAQRAAKPAAEQKTAPDAKKEPAKSKEPTKGKEEKSAKPKSADKAKSKTSVQKVGWFQYLYVEKEKESLNNIPINSNLHPAVVKLGVQLAERVVTGSNARCIALLDAIKKMVRDYSLPARTELGRGLAAQLAAAAVWLAARRAPAAAELNALKHLRRHLTLLPANVDEFDAKKQIQEEIDRYIREQIDMAGEAISLILRNKISPGDHILTYGCSSLIERVLSSAWREGVRFRATVAGARAHGRAGAEMLRRLRAAGLPANYVDISAISYVMNDVQKVVLGAGALLAHGAALGAAGSAQVALVARARNVPVLVACETHKFSERTHLDPLVCHEIGDPDELIDKTDPNSPLKDWRSNPNLTLLNVTYDVTPPSLITAVVTELGILPCTSAPVVLRFKQSEYGM